MRTDLRPLPDRLHLGSPQHQSELREGSCCYRLGALSDPTKLILWQTVPCWGMPSTSPFCIKLETWLRMAEIPYEARVIEGPPRSPAGKVPYVEFADGRLLGDSAVIIETLTREHGVELDAGLSPREQALATATTRMLEDHLYWAIAWDRWVIDTHWAQTRVAYFGAMPWPLAKLAPVFLRPGVKRALRGQGFGRMSEAEILTRVHADLTALATLIDEPSQTLFGRPASIDATVYGFVLAILRPPWDGPLQQAGRRHPELLRFSEAIEARYWSSTP